MVRKHSNTVLAVSEREPAYGVLKHILFHWRRGFFFDILTYMCALLDDVFEYSMRRRC